MCLRKEYKNENMTDTATGLAPLFRGNSFLLFSEFLSDIHIYFLSPKKNKVKSQKAKRMFFPPMKNRRKNKIK